ncbi:ABC transporter ATP-binding protein [Streptomyces koyangensis]|uniref:ABC transporter ATP-binding protein n=1 Tax=Streptomyces koyangensis TaxID=188770 RepID=A0ABX7EFX5_9ACTN|nr:ABC transporter ATP-binding protein [Streptomyces koyangensis]QRF03084.1 ABC transporter ATP-binding protein [Streptomyces koyangensis]
MTHRAAPAPADPGFGAAAPGSLRAEGLGYRLPPPGRGREGALLLDGVDLTVASGETVGVVGPNGSGKTTLLRCVYGTLTATSGRLLLDGQDAARLTAKERARLVAAVPQDATGAFGLTVRETVAMGHSPHKRFWEGDTAEDAAQARAALERVGAAHLADRRLDELSGGERQRVLIARALVQRPRILALDEPTNHLDIRYQLDILHLARTLPPTVLVVLHDLNLAAAYCDRLYVLAAGRVVATGTPAEVLTEELLHDVYGVHTRVGPHPVTGKPNVVYVPE